jgi:hypothetical protein
VFAGFVAVTLTEDTGSATTKRIDAMTQKQLEAEARYVAVHGGVICTRWGCATPYMKRLSRELVYRQFRRTGTERWALCVVERESGFNPGAVSRTNDHGLAQFNAPSWSHLYDMRRLKRDPVYAVKSFFRLSGGGRSTSPWRGGGYSC